MRLVFGAIIAALVLAPAALGKELASVSICGSGGCISSGGGAGGGGGGGTPAGFDAIARAFEGELGGSAIVRDAVPVGEYYKLGVHVLGDQPPPGEFSVEMWYVKPDLIRFVRDGTYPSPFQRLGPAAGALLERLSRDVKPYPSPKIVGASVNGNRAARPSEYLALFGDLPKADPTLATDPRWANVSVVPNRANPWFTADMQFLYMPSEQALFFDKPVKVGYDLASMIARDGGLPAPPKPDGRSWDRPVGIGILAFFLLVGSTVLVLRRRPGHAKGAQPTTA